ncbi:phosphotransferase [Rhizobium sp. PP-CC-3G-465]|uniref:phosphotransferase n=1 Tax=Rhizobium sp. PP-CC-3G-465 TaxID=2135648 RepID=UPI00104CC572|nr:DNA-binding NarL/FixJ family response regulator [Rhizobium sp. PP-CC-3G-465]
MRILFVEDNETFVTQIRPLLAELKGVSEVVHVRTRDAALAAFDEYIFDLVVLDLTIPAEEGSIDIAAEHGQTVFHEVRKIAPGTPTFILTGSEPDEFSRRLARFGENIDLWGDGKATNTVDYFLKEEVDKLIERVSELAATIAETDDLALDTRGRDLGLTPKQKRILKIFSRKAGGVSCEIKSLSGGLSSARVVRAIAKDQHGKHIAVCAGKLGTNNSVEVESLAYEQHVKRLKIGAFPPVFCTIDKGVGGDAGLFYTLADDNGETLFDVIARDPKYAATIVKAIRVGLERWSQASHVEEVGIHDIRRRVVNDDDFEAICKKFAIDNVMPTETSKLRASISCIHGDLHGGNILVDANGGVVIIDFGDVGPGYTCIDPVTLELSLLFHPEAVRLGFSKDLAVIVENWPNIDRYIASNPLGAVIEACRDWAHDVGAGDKDVLSAGYAFAVRQLKYETVHSDITLRLLQGIIAKLT